MTHPLLITEIFSTAQYAFENIHIWRKDIMNYFQLRDSVYHNHDLKTGKSENQYPLIQYRSYDGDASIFAIQEGASILDQDVKAGIYDFKDRNQGQQTELRKQQYPFELQLTESMQYYQIKAYSPFDPEDHQTWLEMGLVAQIQDLEKRLRGSLLVQFCKAVGWKVPATIHIQIMDQKSYERNRDDKGMYYLCFDIVFQINMLLPPRMALGKNVAFGFGVIEDY